MPSIQRVCFRQNVLDNLHEIDIIGGREQADANPFGSGHPSVLQQSFRVRRQRVLLRTT